MNITENHELSDRIKCTEQSIGSLQQSISNLQQSLTSLQTRVDIVVNQLATINNANVLSRHNSFHSELEIEIDEDVHCFLKFLRRITCGRF